MKNYIFIENKKDNIYIGQVKKGELYNFFIKSKVKEQVGQIYKGKVTEIRKNLGAAFIDIGLEKNAFLPIDNDFNKSPGEDIIVEITRPTIGDKGPKVTEEWEISGENLVLMNDGREMVYLSRKIWDELMIDHLIEVGEDFIDGNSILFRTSSQFLPDLEIISEYEKLKEIFDEIKRQENFISEPKLLYDGERKYLEFLTKGKFSHIITNDEGEYNILKKSYPNFKIILDESFSSDTNVEINRAFSNIKRKRVDYESGLSIIYEPLETINFIDINLGSFRMSNNIHANTLNANREAAKIIAKEIRIRNLTGMILIDFMNMAFDDDYNKIFEVLQREMADDYNQIRLLGFTRLGLFEMTREKLNNNHIDFI